MNEKNCVPFEFKFPAIPEKTQRNVIPTGKQIPRTPIKSEDENTQVKELHVGPVLSIPTGKPLCILEIPQSTKNRIPKGKEIPRTPIVMNKVFGSSSSNALTTSFQEVDLGVQPLSNSDEQDDIYFKLEEGILKGKINVREKRSKKKIVDENTLCASKEINKDCKSSSKELSKCTANCQVRTPKDSSEQLCEAIENKCTLFGRSPLKNMSGNDNTNSLIRRNPGRKAKRKVDYKL